MRRLEAAQERNAALRKDIAELKRALEAAHAEIRRLKTGSAPPGGTASVIGPC